MFINIFVFVMTRINLGTVLARRSSRHYGIEVTIPRTARDILKIEAGDKLAISVDIEKKELIYKKVE